MFIFGDIILAVAAVLKFLLNIYVWIIIISALISWVNPDPYNPIVRFLRTATDPVLRPIRNFIGYRLGPIDVSPIVAIAAIMFIQISLIRILEKIGYALGGG
ncbi:MAG: YggT family protein [Nitrospiraceae bacterium]|nr:MAG: YggT family protein [Nitrospiraceae bacterium]